MSKIINYTRNSALDATTLLMSVFYVTWVGISKDTLLLYFSIYLMA